MSFLGPRSPLPKASRQIATPDRSLCSWAVKGFARLKLCAPVLRGPPSHSEDPLWGACPPARFSLRDGVNGSRRRLPGSPSPSIAAERGRKRRRSRCAADCESRGGGGESRRCPRLAGSRRPRLLKAPRPLRPSSGPAPRRPAVPTRGGGLRLLSPGRTQEIGKGQASVFLIEGGDAGPMCGVTQLAPEIATGRRRRGGRASLGPKSPGGLAGKEVPSALPAHLPPGNFPSTQWGARPGPARAGRGGAGRGAGCGAGPELGGAWRVGAGPHPRPPQALAAQPCGPAGSRSGLRTQVTA
jgi:hypothetical protein